MREMINVHRILVIKVFREEPLGRLDIDGEPKEIWREGVDWMQLPYYKVRWWVRVP
jgi:hypothetical protein